MWKRIVLFWVIGLVVLYFTPWWSLAILAALFAYGISTLKKAILMGIWGGAGVWGLMFVYRYYWGGEILTQRMAAMFGLPSAWLMGLLTVILAGMIGGLAAFSCYWVRDLRRAP